jgi:hypothetical protein
MLSDWQRHRLDRHRMLPFSFVSEIRSWRQNRACFKSCFPCCTNLSTATFESGCAMSILDEYAFASCSSLQSICIPSSIEAIAPFCFTNCRPLSTVTFDSRCRISALGESAFQRCALLQSICVRSSVRTISQLCFRTCM